MIPEDWTASKVLPTAAWRASQSRPSILILKDFRLLPHLLLIPRALGGAEELQSGLGCAPRGSAPQSVLSGACSQGCAPRAVLPRCAPGWGAQEHGKQPRPRPALGLKPCSSPRSCAALGRRLASLSLSFLSFGNCEG